MKGLVIGVRAAGAVLVTGCAVVLAAEMFHWRASRQASRGTADGAAVAVIVLGYPTPRSGRPHPVQRWRSEIAVRTLAGSRVGVAAFTGGHRTGHAAEAETMAGYARDQLGLPESQILTETRASTTWENVSFTLPLLEKAERIAFASDPLHAARARRYLSAQRPDLASRLVAADDCRIGEQPFIKLGAAAYEALLAARRRTSSASEHDRAEEPA